MGIINVLDPEVSNLIAAGEVVERPASVVKELVENAIDAQARTITVEIKNGGISYIRVTDNGTGIAAEDVGVAFLRHATSKLRTAKDLEEIGTLGFRGEALCSIAAVSKVKLITKTRQEGTATEVLLEGGEMEDIYEAGAPDGTTIEVRSLFYNTPARMKFLKKDTTEAGYVTDMMQKFVLAHPEISFRYFNNGKQQLFSSGNGELIDAIYTVYGKDYASSVIPVEYGDQVVRVQGYIGRSNISRPNRSYQSFFINGRNIKSATISTALQEGYKNELMGGKFPFAVLALTINPAFLDVNVHPNKMEVKFSDEKKVFHSVYWAVKNGLFEKPTVPEVSLPERRRAYHMPEHEARVYRQSTLEMDPSITPPAGTGGRFHDADADPSDLPIIGEGTRQTLGNTEKQPRRESKLPKGEDSALCHFEDASSYRTETMSPVPAAPTLKEPPAVQYQQNPSSTEKEGKQNFEQSVIPQGNKRRLEDYRIVGQMFATYIILEGAEEMILIDQHAAHERLKYEQLLGQLQGVQAAPQVLLSPVTVQLSPAELALARENKKFFQNIGFEIEEFGNNTIIIQLTPVDLPPEELADLFIELLGQLSSSRQEVIGEKQQRALYTVACKAAIKANHNLSKNETEALVRDVFAMEGINTCPHGRPIMISVSKRELEKQFKRIV